MLICRLLQTACDWSSSKEHCYSIYSHSALATKPVHVRNSRVSSQVYLIFQIYTPLGTISFMSPESHPISAGEKTTRFLWSVEEVSSCNVFISASSPRVDTPSFGQTLTSPKLSISRLSLSMRSSKICRETEYPRLGHTGQQDLEVSQ